jgi:RNA polymerase sigma-70 factor (ECF subfamily)
VALGGGFEQVLIAAQANAGWAFTRLYQSLAGAVAAYVRAQGIFPPDDITSEVFLGVFTRLGSFRGTEEQFRSWVFTIAHHRIVDERRAQARRPPIDDRAGMQVDADARHSGSAEDEALRALGSERARRLLQRLSPDQRDVIAMRVIADLPVDEVARALGKQPGAVRALQHRALATLRRELTDDPVTP